MIIYVAIFPSCEKFESYHDDANERVPVTGIIDSVKAVEIRKELINTLNVNKLLGIQVCVAHHQLGSWSLSLGTTTPAQIDPVRDHHMFRIGSVTKIYTSALVFRLIEEGYLALDQSLVDFYPGIENVEDIAIRNLLAHTSGIRDIFTMPAILINASNFPDKQWDPDQLAKTCMEKPLHFTPGTDYSYSNTNYILLGLIAEEVTGRPLKDLYSEYLLEPLGFSSTFFVPYESPPSDLISGFVHHYALSFKEWYPTVPENMSWPTLAYSSGAMVTTATELASFMVNLFEGKLVSSESLELMTGITDGRRKGLFSINVNGNTYYGHEGEITGFESMALYQPETGISITVCCNTTPFRVKEAVQIIDSTL